MKRRVNLLVTGRVQGVAFRFSARQAAERLGVSGWARNLPNGAVEIEAEAAPEAIERFMDWCTKGPPGARVDGVEIRPASDGPWTGFEIRR